MRVHMHGHLYSGLVQLAFFFFQQNFVSENLTHFIKWKFIKVSRF